MTWKIRNFVIEGLACQRLLQATPPLQTSLGGPGGRLCPPINLGVQLTRFQPEGADYAHHITACPPGFENLMASLYSNLLVFRIRMLGPHSNRFFSKKKK